EFQQLYDDLEAEWQPQTRTEQFYVEQMAVSQWKLRRMEIGEVSLLAQKFGAKNQIPLLDRLWKAEARLERSFSKAQRELERLQNSRRAEPVGVEHARHAQPEAAAHSVPANHTPDPD